MAKAKKSLVLRSKRMRRSIRVQYRDEAARRALISRQEIELDEATDRTIK